MKATQRTSRRPRSPTGPGISLFPFLAVLICTMGALVPLLLAITRTARLQAEAAALAKMAEQGSEVTTQREDVRWRIEQLKKSRGRVQSQLADARLELGHIEDHSRRLRGQLAQYQRTITDIQSAKNLDQERLRQSQTELDQARTQIAAARQQLADAGKLAAGHNRCYAVVPYEGPNQTHRRPIYLECRADCVVLQPEGIELTEEDFEGPLGPGNPLAATLRAAREYMLANRQFDPQGGDPYPMLLVRPEGISAYYAAREAMKSWGFDFGYELVEDEWKLAFPPPDPRLAEVVRQVIASARMSQARLVAAAPRHYGGGTKTTYRAAPGGGFVRETAPAKNEDRGYASVTPAGPVGAAVGSGGGTPATNASATGGTAGYHGDGPALTGVGGGGTGYGGDGPALTDGGSPYGATGNRAETAMTGVGGGTEGYDDGSAPTGLGGSLPYGATGSRPGTGMREGNSVAAATPSKQSSGSVAPSGDGVAVGRSGFSNQAGTQPGHNTERPEGYVTGQPPREQAASTQPTASDTATRGRALLPGEWQPAPDRPKTRREDKDDNTRAGKHAKSLAQERGVDWGVRDAAHGSTGVTRPIRVDCYADRLVVVSDRGPAADTAIALGPRTETSIDRLVSAVWEHMETWGMAGRGMYWRPLLHVYVAPDAEQRFAELAALLAGSGVMIQRK